MENNLSSPLVSDFNGGVQLGGNKVNFLKIFSSGESALSRHEKSLFKAVFVLGIGGWIVGYNVGIVAGGFFQLSTVDHISHNQEAFIVSALYIGAAIGSIIAGPFSDSIGRWRSCQVQSLLFIIGSMLIGNSKSIAFLIAGRVINGMGMAFALISSLPYLNEISPLKYTGRFQGSFELFITLGLLFSTVMNVLANNPDLKWVGLPAWRWTHVFPVFLAAAQALLLFFLPESPQFLVQKGRDDQATAALESMYADPEAVRYELNQLKLTNMSKSTGVFKTFYFAMQKYSVAMYVVLGLVAVQSFSGGYVWESFAPFIFQEIGFSRNTSLHLTLALGTVRILLTLVIMFYVDSKRAGRKQLLTYGTITMLLGNILFPIAASTSSAVFQGISSLIIIIGNAVGFSIVLQLLQSEMFPTLIRSRSIAISLFLQSILKAIILFVFFSVERVHRNQVIFFFFAGGSFLAFIYVRMFTPETLRRTANETRQLILANLTNRKYLEWRSFYHNEALDAPTGDERTISGDSSNTAVTNRLTNDIRSRPGTIASRTTDIADLRSESYLRFTGSSSGYSRRSESSGHVDSSAHRSTLEMSPEHSTNSYRDSDYI